MFPGLQQPLRVCLRDQAHNSLVLRDWQLRNSGAVHVIDDPSTGIVERYRNHPRCMTAAKALAPLSLLQAFILWPRFLCTVEYFGSILPDSIFRNERLTCRGEFCKISLSQIVFHPDLACRMAGG